MNRGFLALTHLPSLNMNAAVRTYIDVESIDACRAALQHADYRRVLQAAGAEVVVLDVNREHPDAVFVEDTAVVLDECAIVTSMGTPSRRGEIHGIERELRRHRTEIARIELPGTLEGGDVLRVGRTLFVGETGRTNREGFASFAHVAGRYGYAVRGIKVTGCLHLKTACGVLPDGTILAHASWIDASDFNGFSVVAIADDEPYAANTVLVGDRVVMASAHPRTIESVRRLGFHVDDVHLDEFAKAEGGPSCLSVIVSPAL